MTSSDDFSPVWYNLTIYFKFSVWQRRTGFSFWACGHNMSPHSWSPRKVHSDDSSPFWCHLTIYFKINDNEEQSLFFLHMSTICLWVQGQTATWSCHLQKILNERMTGVRWQICIPCSAWILLYHIIGQLHVVISRIFKNCLEWFQLYAQCCEFWLLLLLRSQRTKNKQTNKQKTKKNLQKGATYYGYYYGSKFTPRLGEEHGSKCEASAPGAISVFKIRLETI